MGTEQYTPFAFRIIGADNIARFQDGVVVSHQVGMLVVYFGAEFFQLLGKEFSAGFVGGGVGHARTKIRLGLYVLICTVCTELRHLDSRFGRIALTVIIGCRLAAVVAACHYRYNQQQQQRDECIIPFHSLSVLKLSFTSFFPTFSVTAAPFISGTFMLTCPTGKSKHIG